MYSCLSDLQEIDFSAFLVIILKVEMSTFCIFDSVGERKSCLSLSNLGLVKMPVIMRQYIRRMDFILGVQAAAPYNCGMLSFGDTIYINFILNIRDPELERHFFAVLREMGLPVTVESNRD